MASNPIDCIKLHAKYLSTDENISREAATDLALKEFEKLHGELENFKKLINPKYTKQAYVSPDKSARIKEIQDEYQAKIDEANTPIPEPIKAEEKPQPEKTIVEDKQGTAKTKQQELADKVRTLKINLGKLSGGGMQSNVLGLPAAVWNGSMEVVAKAIEAGGNAVDAIKKGLKYIQANHRGQWDKKGFNEQVMKELGVRGITVNGEDFIIKNDAKTEREFAQTVNGWYSDLEQSVLDVKGEKGSGESWQKVLGKSDEAKWTGLNDWLFQQKGQVSKKDILNYLKDNRIEIVEVEKTDNLTDSADEADAMGEYSGGIGDAKFSQYQIEGEKSNYKEVLVTMPSATKVEMPKPIETYTGSGKYKLVFDNGNQLSGTYTKEEVADVLKRRSEDKTGMYIDRNEQFKSSHFEEPNILVHLRMNTRVDAEGKKVLFLEEVQSDWGQQGKKSGFANTEQISKLRDEETKLRDSVKKNKGKITADTPDDVYNKIRNENKLLEEQIYAIQTKITDLQGKSTPTAPFVTDTNSWTKLGLKVALKEAVKQGAEKIAWTTGEQQNDRYDLSKSVNRVTSRSGTDVKYVDIDAKSGSISLEVSPNGKVLKSESDESFGQDSFVGTNLSDVIGKEVADKIISSDKVDLSGEGLKVGGKGMKGFYGSPTEGSLGIVGNVAKSLFKQEPKTVSIETGIRSRMDKYEVVKRENGKYALRDIEEDIIITNQDNMDGFATKADANEYAKEYFGEYPETSTQHSIDITPELKAEVEGGLPLFKDIKGRGKEIADLLRKGKIKQSGLQSNIAGIPIAVYNGAIEVIARALEGGATLTQAINRAYQKLKIKEKHKNFNQDEFIKKLEEATGEKFEDSEGAGKEPPIEPPKKEGVVEDGGEGKKQLDKLANNIPDTGEVAKYMSKDTIEKYTGETPTNDQRRGVQELEIALNHGERIIEKAKEVFGKDYVEKTLDYIDESTAGVSNKALMYVSLENALGREKLANPEKSSEITKQQALVYAKSQAFARENSLALNYQKLRKIAKVGYDISKVTDSFFSSEEKVARDEISKAVEADPDAINKEAESKEVGGMTPDIEKLVQEGVDKEINKIYESLPAAKKSAADKAIKALDAVQKKLRSRTYDATLGIPVAIIDAGITVIKRAIKLGVNIADAVEAGIKTIKEKYGKEWENEDVFRKDAIAEFEKNLPNTKKIVKEALIEKGFGREINVKGEKKTILDWKKLAGAAGTVEKIKENVEAALSDKGVSQKDMDAMSKDLTDEYISLRTSIIEKAQNELAKRNRVTVNPEQKSAAKKLSELYTYGLFDAKVDEFENTLNKALGAKVSEKGFNEAKEIAKALETIYTNTFKGVRLSDISAKAAIEKLEDRLRVLLFREAKSQGNWMLKAANIVRNYFEIQQTMILNNLKQAVENPFSGMQQKVIDKISSKVGGESTKELVAQRRKMMKDIYKDMILNGGIGYGKVESQFVNRQHIDDYVNKLSDNKLYHGIASVVTGKATLNAMDAMFKAGITEAKFTGNLIRILTDKTNPKRMSKEDAVKFVSERLTGQTFKEAQVTAKQVIEKINKDAGSELLPTNQQAVDRFANDIVKAALEMGGKITKEQIEAAYGAAYKAAGLGLGHEANNILSSTIKGYSAKLEGDINLAIKEKEWNRAAMLTYKSILFRNVLNPFVGGGTNWLVLKFEKTGLGLVTGAFYQIGSKHSIDVGSELGQKRLEARLYNHARYKDNYMRGLVGGITALLAYAAFRGVADEEEYRKWRAKNRWAARYLDIITPEHILAKMAIEDGKVKQYASNSFNKNDAFDASTKLIKGFEYGAKGDLSKMWGAFGESVGGKLNAPVPWRLIKDGKVLYQGVKGEDPWHGNYKPSEGFLSGILQGGVIEWLGLRPMPESSQNPQRPKIERPKPQKISRE